jgi:hypothetical protein
MYRCNRGATSAASGDFLFIQCPPTTIHWNHRRRGTGPRPRRLVGVLMWGCSNAATDKASTPKAGPPRDRRESNPDGLRRLQRCGSQLLLNPSHTCVRTHARAHPHGATVLTVAGGSNPPATPTPPPYASCLGVWSGAFSDQILCCDAPLSQVEGSRGVVLLVTVAPRGGRRPRAGHHLRRGEPWPAAGSVRAAHRFRKEFRSRLAGNRFEAMGGGGKGEMPSFAPHALLDALIFMGPGSQTPQTKETRGSPSTPGLWPTRE